LGIEVLAGDIYLTTEPLRGGGLINDREAAAGRPKSSRSWRWILDPGAVLGNLSTAFWQLTEIAKALAQDAQVLIMDEPTASLAKHETEHLFQLVERLKARESRSSHLAPDGRGLPDRRSDHHPARRPATLHQSVNSPKACRGVELAVRRQLTATVHRSDLLSSEALAVYVEVWARIGG
jgi:hypothetical protein